MTPPARRVTLAPIEVATDAELTEAAMLLPDALDGRDVGVGDEVTAGPVALLVTGTSPPGLVRFRAAESEAALQPRPPSAPKRPVFDVLFLVDASWTMGKERERRFAPYRYVPPALEAFQRQCADFVRATALVAFSREAVLLQDFDPLAALDPARLARVPPRGPTLLPRAVDCAVATLAERADPRDRHAVVLFTDDDGAADGLPDAARRAARVGVPVHVVDVGDRPSSALKAFARDAGGTYVHAPETATAGVAATEMAREAEVPFAWVEPAVDGDDTEFEIVLRAMPEE